MYEERRGRGSQTAQKGESELYAAFAPLCFLRAETM